MKLKTIHMSALTMQKNLETGRKYSMGRIFFLQMSNSVLDSIVV